MQVNDKLKGWPDFFPEATIPDALFQGEMQRALTAQEYYGNRTSELRGAELDLKLGVVEVCSEISFAAAVATHAAAYLSPDDLQETMGPLIQSCINHSERALAAYEEFQPLLHKRSPTIALYLTYPLLRQSILGRALYTYLPDNDAAASARQELARSAYAYSKAPLGEMFEAYNLGRLTGMKAFSGSLQEATINALINRERNSSCLALPALDAEDHYFKSDNMVLTYDDFGSFIQYIQSKGDSRNGNTGKQLAELSFQALVHPALLGNAIETPKRMRKTWATTRAIIGERADGKATARTSRDIGRYLTQKRTELLICIDEEAVAFPLRLWNIPSRR